ncbi:MaoC family dehydratase [Epidermidibacterium keratini]|uniref:MaoC family dehydratase n=1 Tax=Epidermidibacterium keratini TaxID=1891644 RepID=A0A7L4YP42_9ACTN|nr:MaoC family dehydratase N-terminal domain-containing protein [Epidermidibacterium keratini]QHC00644.1 MaoC family dehydratase [Epidermidibacterium keratini]
MQATDVIGRALEPFTATAERGQIAFFAEVVGLDDPVYRDVEAARAAGHRDIPLPPTFLFSLELLRPNPRGILTELGIDMRSVLHGEQAFDYHAAAYAGDELTFSGSYTDYYEKKGGALRFLVRQSDVTRGDEPIATLTNVLISRAMEGLS